MELSGLKGGIVGKSKAFDRKEKYYILVKPTKNLLHNNDKNDIMKAYSILMI